MSDELARLEATKEKIAELQEQIDLLKGSVKVDENEARVHPKILKGLGDYAEIRLVVAGDYAFNTRFDKTCRIELKTWDNLIGDIGTRHVTDQLRRMQNDISILLIEGWITTTHGGMVRTQSREYRHRPFTWLWNYLLSVQLSGTYIYLSPNEFMTSNIILSIFNYFNKEEHAALSKRQRLISMHPDLTPKQVAFSALPAIGSEIAKKLDEHFHHSMKELCDAEVDDIQQIEGIGKKKAELIYKFLRNLI